MNKTTIVGVLKVVVAVCGIVIAAVTGQWGDVGMGVVTAQGLLSALGFKVAGDAKKTI